MLELKRQEVRVIGGKTGVSQKTGKNYAMLETKTSSGYADTLFIDQPSQEIQDTIKGLDDQMGAKITIVTSVEVQ